MSDTNERTEKRKNGKTEEQKNVKTEKRKNILVFSFFSSLVLSLTQSPSLPASSPSDDVLSSSSRSCAFYT
jgi:hypothetical protein